MNKENIIKEEEDINEEDKDSQSDDINLQRKRFNYSNMIFDTDFYEKNMINKGQYGHKKYSYYTENSRKAESVRNIVLDHPKYNPKLTEDFKSVKIENTGGKFFTFSKIIIFIFFVIFAAIQFYHKPQSHLMKIRSGVDAISEKVGELRKASSISDYAFGILISQMFQIGGLLNDSSLRNIVASEIRKQGIAPLLYQTIKSHSTSCESGESQIIIQVSLKFLHDLTAFSNGFKADIESLTKVYSNCIDIIEIDDLVFSVLNAYIHKAKNLTLLNGITKPIVKAILRDGNFGPWDLGPMKFFAYWSANGRIPPEDKENICKFVEFSVNNRNSWNRQFTSMLCLLSQNVECKSFENVNLNDLYRRDECKSIFQQHLKKHITNE